MDSPLDRVRARLIAFRGTEAALALARLEGQDESPFGSDAARARAALGTGENRADLEEARSRGELTVESEALLFAHLADAAGAESFARAGVPAAVRGDAFVTFEGRRYELGALGAEALVVSDAQRASRVRAVAAVLDRDRRARREALDRAEEARARVLVRASPSPDRAPDELSARCAAFLSATDELAIELGARLVHARRLGGEDPLTALLAALGASDGPSVWRKPDHGPAVTALLGPLGLAGPLSRGVRLAAHVLATLEAPVVMRAGSSMVVHTPGRELGVVSRVLAVESSVRALALTLVAGSASFEVRVPASGSTAARALGVTLATGLAQPTVLVRSLGLDPGQARTEALAAALALLITARLRATRSIAVRDRPDDEEARARGARALGLREPLPSPEPAHATHAGPAELDAATRASLVGLSAMVALRERFDVDWARNPRVEHVFRAASHHGAALSAERWLAEIGGRPEDATSFGRELAG